MSLRNESWSRQSSPRRIRLRGRVLIGEASLSRLREITEHLQSLGLTVDSEPDSHALLKRLGSGPHHYDAVLLGVDAPRAAGLDTLQLIRLLRHDSARIPVVMVAQQSNEQTYRQCVHHGATEYLCAPFSRHDLQEALRPHCGHLAFEAESETRDEQHAWHDANAGIPVWDSNPSEACS